MSNGPTEVVPAGYVILIGDNWPHRLDSRVFGPVPLEEVDGEVIVVFGDPAALKRTHREVPPSAHG